MTAVPGGASAEGAPAEAASADHSASASASGSGTSSGNDNPTASSSSGSRTGTGSSSGSGSGRRRGEASSSSSSAERTLGDVMRDPSTTVPDVVVLDTLPETSPRRDVLDPKEDLWLSTVDGRYNSPIIPLRVGPVPYHETFYVHKHVLLKSEYFEKALCGDFQESETQSIDLPEEDPAIFHFLIAYLYEGRYEPIKPAASVLVPDLDKGKGNAADAAAGGSDSDSDSASSYHSDVSAQSRRRRERHRRREDRNWERMRQKHPGLHRPNCNCPQCAVAAGPPCWSCRAPRNPPPHPPPYHHFYMGDNHFGRPDRQPRRPPRRRHGVPPPPRPMTPPPPPGGRNGAANGTANANANATTPAWPADPNGGRIAGEDLRTWLLAYELNLDVYILANKFLLEGLKKEIARAAIDMLETAGSDAAVAEVLFLCRKLYEGLPEHDPLLKMVFARVGFLQPWRRAERAANEFLIGNPEIAPLLLREMAARREDDVNGRTLPSMVRPWYSVGAPRGAGFDYAPRPPGYQGVWAGAGPGPGPGPAYRARGV
ncbi:hypothetical protein C8A05DRAFT_38274 [Staphylotrichum tortipilum]|uniref:BTB domain-containing protein n=1 Tax=Staphylotrichum tortipilum TaxID=2831512 RepID=A0AAN6MDW1_9PEZI|nr:hypothetical protein C8A05DRAFT_38274 [Staphylotrichum longicolle]